MAKSTTQTQSAATKQPQRKWDEVVETGKRTDIPEGLWLRCPNCAAMVYRKSLEQNLHVCPECDHHMRVDADTRARQLCDPDSFEPMWENLVPVDSLNFTDLKAYKDVLASDRKKTGHADALVCGKGFIKGRGVMLACMDFRFRGASMGSVVGEKITRCIEMGIEQNLPVIIASCSGGAR
ncbi:MAG: carboxyl transferase domain-containing protein, partial [Phycisphaeraceae bacterium JB051]